MYAGREDIPIGKENAVTRESIARLWGVDDRTARKIIEGMRRQESEDGYVIVSSSHSAGYWRTDDIDEIRRYINENTRRAGFMFQTIQSARKVLQAIENKDQLQLEV